MNGQKQTEDAQKVLDFFTDLMETSKTHLKYYLAEDIVLDWFGQTIRGQKKVASFIKTKVNPIRHLFKEAKSTSKIGFRDTHLVKAPKSKRRILRSSFLSPPRPTLMNTPVKQLQPSTSARRLIGKLNFDSNGSSKSKSVGSPSPPMNNSLESPRKRQKLSSTRLDTSDIDILEPESDSSDVKVQYLTAEGHVEFHRPSSKKIMKETKWQRPCKIHIAYDSGKDVKDSNFYLIIYEGNVKCRRSLIKSFDAEEPDN
ncbi:hypothetical protein HUJ04_009229 [Dendroctonus ponderosae]|uniref:Uncharacterized protein n=1 Tax=Dendroctonus ponderosae TaxID=77166 RepID=A0AAR5NX15_DENPD|nr:hypothetical protein HUJ04_009229 [Dendroctonus ponderosae]